MTIAPNPALVTREAARRLPRLALLLLCAAYLLPGLFGRDPWRGADITAFGQMLGMAEGRVSWLAPSLGGVATEAALLPHWVGAVSIAALSPWLDAAVAARLPFALLLALTLLAIWRACRHLALTEGAQPLPFAFGGEAEPADYARAVADGALLAAIATLGLLQLGHETTPELAQLAALACFQWALCAAEAHPRAARLGVLLALPALAASDAPALAALLGTGSTLLCWRGPAPAFRRFLPWAAGATLLAMLLAWPLHAWRWRLGAAVEPLQLARLFVWFLWPVWPLAGWTVWRWRRHLLQAHIAIPLLSVAIALATSVMMGGSDRALMLALPGGAILAAFALPTLRRSTTSAIDWFSVFFFSLCALTIWVVYLAMQTGVPAKTAANVAKLAVGFRAPFSIGLLLLAVVGSVAWLALVRWRTGQHQAALWKSLVLPAGGVALCWLLLMTLWLPLLDYGRSYRPVIERVQHWLPAGACVAAPKAAPALVAALEYHGRRRVEAGVDAAAGRCGVMVTIQRGSAVPAQQPGWTEVARTLRPTDRHEWLVIHRRTSAPVTALPAPPG